MSAEYILIVDAARMGKKQGEYEIFRMDDVKTEKVHANLSTHEGDVLKVLSLARDMNYKIPRIELMGIEPEDVKDEAFLSESLSKNIDKYLEIIQKLVL